MRAEEIARHVATQHRPPAPVVVALLGKLETTEAEIRDAKYMPDAERDRVASARAETLAKADVDLETALTAGPLDGGDRGLIQLRQDRSRALGVMKANIESGPRRQQLTLDTLIATTAIRDADPTAAQVAYDDALLGEDDVTIRAIGASAVSRLRTLALAEPESQRIESAAYKQWRALESRQTAWTREHPSPGDQVRAADKAIAGREQQLRAGRAWMLKAAGLRS